MSANPTLYPREMGVFRVVYSVPHMRFSRTGRRQRWTSWWVIAPAFFVLVAGAFLGYQRSPRLQRAVKTVSYRLGASDTKVASRALTVRLNVPYHRQEHALSCEVAALQMVLNYAGVPVTESELILRLPFATREPRGRDNIWGDPDVGFVGAIDGISPQTGYGVYEPPLVWLAQQYRPARAVVNATLRDVLTAVLAQRPVIVWGTLASGQDVSWRTPEGKPVKAIFGEHTRVVIGFSGTVENPTAIVLHDPIYGTISMTRKKFEADWALLGNKAVVVE